MAASLPLVHVIVFSVWQLCAEVLVHTYQDNGWCTQQSSKQGLDGLTQ